MPCTEQSAILLMWTEEDVTKMSRPKLLPKHLSVQAACLFLLTAVEEAGRGCVLLWMLQETGSHSLPPSLPFSAWSRAASPVFVHNAKHISDN